MKNRFYKILSVILAVAMIFSVYSIVTTAIEPTENSSRVVDYYVKNGGTGNGKTVLDPAPTVAAVIDTINNVDNLTAIDIANVYIMQRDDIGTDATKFTAWTAYGTKDVPAHTAQLVVQSYGSETLNLAFHDGRYQDQNL